MNEVSHLNYMNLMHKEIAKSKSSDVVFSLKLFAYVFLIVLGIWLSFVESSVLRCVGFLLLGAMFAHGVELQHQALHGQGFRNRKINEAVGIILGIPMLVSFSDYRSGHLHHHKAIGTPDNQEFFEYGDQYGSSDNTSFFLWCIRLLILKHYFGFFKNSANALLNKPFKNKSKRVCSLMRRDYLLILAVVITGILIDVFSRSFIFTVAWFAPLFFVAGPMHALIELPEHFRCDTSSTNPFMNTRTIRSNAFMYWFTNGNNFHVEHHLMPSLPIDRLYELHEKIADKSMYFCRGYREFYAGFFEGFSEKNDR